MYDYGLSVIEKYELQLLASCRMRGGLVCRTDKGQVQIREFKGSPKKLEREWQLLENITHMSDKLMVDTVLRNKEGELTTADKDGITYVIRNYPGGRECDLKSKEQIVEGAKVLARLHKTMILPIDGDYVHPSLMEEYERHNRQLRKIRQFIRKKRNKSDFDWAYLEHVDYFLEWGEEALTMLKATNYEQLRILELAKGKICHGEFTHHNILFSENGCMVTNFEHWNYDVQIADLYLYMRKILEKNHWNVELGKEILEGYEQERSLSVYERKNLQVRLVYPQKFWKLANQYYSRRKAWIPKKNMEKLQNLIDSKASWENFAKKLI